MPVLAAQQPTPGPEPRFRAGVDVVLVEARVVDGSGQPITDLGPADFEVSIGGRRRTVVFAEFIQYGAGVTADEAGTDESPSPLTETAPRPSARSAASDRNPTAPTRVFVLAIDALSFTLGASRGVAAAAEEFVQGLQATDLVGLFTYPLGPKVDPTIDHGRVMTALTEVTGQRSSAGMGEFRMSPAEVVDFATRGSRTPSCPYTFDCVLEAQAAAIQFEGMATVSLNMLRSLLTALGQVEGDRTVVLVSAGMVTSDRPGGRPDVGELGIEVGREAARHSIGIYTLFVDQSWIDSYLAELPGAGRGRTIAQAANQRRNSEILARWLDQFTGTAGGVLLEVRVGSGEVAFDRILRETSALYVIGVELAGSDRNGRVQDLSVRTRRSGAMVRSRSWIAVPAGQ
jgi:VWFA-related protein